MKKLAFSSSLFSLLSLLTLTGCVTSTIQEVREANTGLGKGESIVVLGRRDLPTATETELDFVSCVGHHVSNGSDGLEVIEQQHFRDALFPWFEPRTAPLNTSDLPEIMALPLLTGRLKELGLRYVIWIEGSTKRTDSSGSMSCSITGAGGGCFGFLSWENDSSYEALVWDLTTGNSAGRLSSDANGTSYMPAVIVPLPLIARVQNSACSSLASQLKQFISPDDSS